MSATEKGRHPDFSNPTIQEALCEIHFRLPEGKNWDPNIFSALFNEIKSDFPTFEPILLMGVQVQIQPGTVGQSLLPPRQMMRYKHANNNFLLQFAPGLMTFNVLPRYPGWEKMGSEILKAWSHICKIIKPVEIERLALRYINRIDRTKGNEKPLEWFKPSDFISKSVLESSSGFINRTEFSNGNDVRAAITLAELSGNEPKPILFDIECTIDKPLKIDSDIVKENLYNLNEKAWRIFDSSKSERLTRRLEGKE